MKKNFSILFFILLTQSVCACCIEDNRTLTERLYLIENDAIFTCKILTTTTDENGYIQSTAKLIEVYFGEISKSIITLKTGNINSSVSPSHFPVGSKMLVYSNGKGNTFSCGGSCDKWTKLVSNKHENEIKTLQKFSEISKKRKSGKYKFFYSNGRIAASGTFKKGVPTKLWKHYNTSGNIKIERNLKSKSLLIYYKNGLLKMSEEQKNDTLIRIVYSEKIEFQKFQKQLEIKTDSGKISIMNEYNEEGFLTRRYSRNYIQSEYGWTSDGKTGEYREYYPTGKIMVKGQFRKNKKVGIWTWLMEDGTIRETQNYDM